MILYTILYHITMPHPYTVMKEEYWSAGDHRIIANGHDTQWWAHMAC